MGLEKGNLRLCVFDQVYLFCPLLATCSLFHLWRLCVMGPGYLIHRVCTVFHITGIKNNKKPLCPRQIKVRLCDFEYVFDKRLFINVWMTPPNPRRVVSSTNRKITACSTYGEAIFSVVLLKHTSDVARSELSDWTRPPPPPRPYVYTSEIGKKTNVTPEF